MRYYTPPLRRRTGTLIRLLALLVILGCFLFQSIRFLRRLTTEMALSSVSDAIMYAISDAVGRCMDEGGYGYEDFVAIERDAAGAVKALKTNMAAINALSSEILTDVVTVTERSAMEVAMPLGNLLGSTFLLGKGPLVTVKIVPLTSSHVQIRNELTTAGINQTRHQIIMEVDVDVTVLIPWSTAETSVACPVLIAETIIVGDVPNTYFISEAKEMQHDA